MRNALCPTAPGDDFLDRLVLDEPIARREPPFHIDAAPGKPDRDRIGPHMRGRFEPVFHRQYLLRRTLQQGREPTACEGLFVRLDDINARRRIYRSTHTCRRPTCHAHHLLLLLLCCFPGLVGMVRCLAITLLLACLAWQDDSMNTSWGKVELLPPGPVRVRSLPGRRSMRRDRERESPAGLSQ